MDPQRFVLLFLVTCVALNCVTGQCTLEINKDFDTASPQPVYIKNGEYMVPDNSCNIKVLPRQKVVIACPGSRNHIIHTNNNKKIIRDDTLEVECIQDDIFKERNVFLRLKQLSCNRQPDVTIYNTTNACVNNSRIAFTYRVGYMVQNNLYTLYDVCFDYNILTTYYVAHKVYPHSCLTQKGKPQSFQINNMFKNVPITDLYTKTKQQERFEEIFGKSQTYIQNTTSKHALEKGHLASRADYTMAAQLRATYQYINAAPQFREVNAPRWFSLERALRQYMKGKQTPVQVYTGTHGVLSLPKTNSLYQEVYLYTDATNTDVVPVPLYFYKVVDEPGHRTAYVTVNWDAFNSTQLASLRFCNDTCMLDWKNKGDASFCCDYANFKKIIGILPI